MARLVELLKEFGNTPNAIAEYLLAHGAFKQSFVNKVVNSANLGDAKKSRPPYFTDLESMLDYKDQLLSKEESFVDMEGDVAETVQEREIRLGNMYLERLRDALAREDYLEAAKVRDFITFAGFKIPTNFS